MTKHLLLIFEKKHHALVDLDDSLKCLDVGVFLFVSPPPFLYSWSPPKETQPTHSPLLSSRRVARSAPTSPGAGFSWPTHGPWRRSGVGTVGTVVVGGRSSVLWKK